MTLSIHGIDSLDDIASPELLKFHKSRQKLAARFQGILSGLPFFIIGPLFEMPEWGFFMGTFLIAVNLPFYIKHRKAITNSKFSDEDDKAWHKVDTKGEQLLLNFFNANRQYASIVLRLSDTNAKITRAETEFLHRYDLAAGGKGIPFVKMDSKSE